MHSKIERLIRRVAGRGDGRTGVWREVIGRDDATWQTALAASRGGQRVLIATSLGGYDHGVMLESALAAALTLRGASVDILLCDEMLPACQLTKIQKIEPDDLERNGQRKLCGPCFRTGLELYGPLGLPIHRFSALVSSEQADTARGTAGSVPLEDIGRFTWDGLAVGEHASAGALRYFARGDLHNEPLGERILRRYFEAALLSVFAVEELLRRNRYEVACFHHGIYVPQGLIGEVCRRQGVRVVNSNPAYRKQTFIFSHGNSYHHTMISEPTGVWENLPWSPGTQQITLDYLKSRWSGSEDWIWFHEKPEENVDKIVRKVGAEPSKPWIGLLTNVMWDAQLHYGSNAFPNMLTWVLHTIRRFETRPDIQLIIRVHPAEIRGAIPSRQPIVPEIRRAFPRLPSNVFLIPPESPVSTYAVMERCDTVLIYNTKTGIELSSMGIPVVVAGEAWIRNKGFSIDASSVAEYDSILGRLPAGRKLEPDQLQRAQKYAFHFFFRRMIPLPFITSPERFRFALRLEGLDQLRPGRTPGLDVVCDGILKESPFIYPAEQEKTAAPVQDRARAALSW
jgi:hypothetical protein